MVEEEKLVAMFTDGVSYVTGDNRFAERIGKRIVKNHKVLGVISLILWSLILFIWLVTTRS
jgi:K+ transporter